MDLRYIILITIVLQYTSISFGKVRVKEGVERMSREVDYRKHFSPKHLVGSPYEIKDQASFPTSTSMKSNDNRLLSLKIKQK